jgi:hypothetical protein
MTDAKVCEQVRISAMAVADCEESPMAEAQIVEHLLECPACREEIDRVVGRDPLPSNIDWAESAERVWPPLRIRLQQNETERTRNELPTTDRSRTGIGRVRWAIWSGTAVCACMAIGIGWWMSRSEPIRVDANQSKPEIARPLVLIISESAISDSAGGSSESGQNAPFGEEADADDIALAVVGETFERDGKKMIYMELLVVFKGRLPTGTFGAEDRPVYRVECSLPERLLGLRSQLFRQGSRVAIYLDHPPSGGWTAKSIRDLSTSEQSWRESVKRFCDVQMAAEADDPAERYRELLAVEQPLLLDDAAYHALMYTPSIHALPMVRQHWQRSIGGKPISVAGMVRSSELPVAGGAGGFGGGGFGGDGVVGGTRSTPSPTRLARVLARLNDAESVKSVLQYGMLQPPDARSDYLELLPALCQNADAVTLRFVRGEVKKAMDRHLTSTDAAFQTDLVRHELLGLKAVDEQLQELLAKAGQRQ